MHGPEHGSTWGHKEFIRARTRGLPEHPIPQPLIVTETKFATGRSWALGPSVPDPLAAPGPAEASPHGSLASAAPFLVWQTAVPVSAVSRGLEG